MNKTKLSIVVVLLATGILQASSDNNSTTTVADAFKNGKISGQIRAGFLYADPKILDHPTLHSTAIGGELKYETSKLYGINLGVAFYTSHAIDALSGDREAGEFNDEQTGEDGHYDLLAEAYIDYAYDNLHIRIGRQVIDTPYADSDDIRMTPNSFEALMAKYSYGDFGFVGGYITRWQGPDAGEYEFVDLLEDGGGVAMLAATYEGKGVETSLWYYYADHMAHILYGDIASSYMMGNTKLTGALQIANQSELEDSGMDASLYGAKAGVEYTGLSLGIAYNRVIVTENKKYCSGFGGGVGFVNMFEMTAGVFTLHQSTTGWKGTISYDLSQIGVDDLSLTYDYGIFRGDVLHEAKEHNLILSYTSSDNFDIEMVYDRIEDVHKDIDRDHQGEHRDYSSDKILVRANYNF